MTRRSTPQRAADEKVFSVRVTVRTPNTDFARELGLLLAWLHDGIGSGGYGCHADRPLGPDALAFYFREVGDAARFLDAFPHLELADGTQPPAYSSPLASGSRGA